MSPIDGSFSSKLRLLLEIIWVLIKSLPTFGWTFYRKWFPGEGKDVTDKVILITGTGNGLGRELAIQFAKLGSRVICVDIRKKDNEQTVEDIISQTGRETSAVSFTCDVSDQHAVESLKDSVLKEFHHVDILINNAGIVYGNRISTGEVENIKRVINVNLMSPYWMTRAFVTSMRKRQKGHIVFINSMASLTPLGSGLTYNVSKFGLLGLSMSLIEDFRKDPSYKNVKISSVHPYFIGTDDWYTKNLFKIRIKALKTSSAARQIITGIRREYSHYQIPGYETGFWLCSLLRLLPAEVYHKIRDIVNCDLAVIENDREYRNIPGKVSNG